MKYNYFISYYVHCGYTDIRNAMVILEEKITTMEQIRNIEKYLCGTDAKVTIINFKLIVLD